MDATARCGMWGGQLRFDLISYYSIPTRVQVDVAYGIDEVPDKGRWKSYFHGVVWVFVGGIEIVKCQSRFG